MVSCGDTVDVPGNLSGTGSCELEFRVNGVGAGNVNRCICVEKQCHVLVAFAADGAAGASSASVSKGQPRPSVKMRRLLGAADQDPRSTPAPTANAVG